MFRSRDAVVVGPPVPSLVHWGRSADADLIYRTLVMFGPGTAGDLERELGLPRRRVAAALEELVSIGAITTRSAESRRRTVWVAEAPVKVIEALRRRRVPSGGPAGGSHEPGAVPDHLSDDLLGPAAGLRHLRTRALTRIRLAELTAVTSQERLAMNPEPVFDADAARAGVTMDRLMLSRGVPMRVLGVQHGDPDPLLNYGRRPAETRPDYRVTSTVPMKLIVVDRKIALFPVDPGNLERGYLEVAQEPVVAALVSLFERHWESARDPWEWAVPTIALAPRERALIKLLAQGHTDPSAARKLHISTRTVSTIMRGLMDRLGVDNRFQLGLALGALRAAEPGPRTPDNDQEPR
ncbi:helix-turn-helix transcriptional regulator [Actinomycetes bacterium KLBMP 9797]